jgi:hypothetical protein
MSQLALAPGGGEISAMLSLILLSIVEAKRWRTLASTRSCSSARILFCPW